MLLVILGNFSEEIELINVVSFVFAFFNFVGRDFDVIPRAK